jgi:hypothetical protein
VNALKRKVVSEILFAPSVMLPLVAGITSSILSWGVGGNLWLSIAGGLAIALSLGWVSTRWLFQRDSITQQVLEDMRAREIEKEAVRLDELTQLLRNDRDHRTEDDLLKLRGLKKELDSLRAKTANRARFRELTERVEKLFHNTLDQLQETYRLYQTSRNTSKEVKLDLLKQRDAILLDINESLVQLKSAIEQFHSLTSEDSPKDHSKLRDDLDNSLRLAQRTEERMREIEGTENWNSMVKETQ